MARIEIEFDHQQLQDHMRQLFARLDDMRPAMQEIGEYLVMSTKDRFPAGIAPDGAKWAPNRPITLARKKGNRPLIGETHRLGSEIIAQVGADTVEVGSNLVYAAVQQLGAAQGEFGSTTRGNPIPWGNIPARPFLGLSDDDERNVLDIVHEYLAGALDGASP